MNFPIRNEPVWELRLKLSHSVKRSVALCGTYISWDDDDDLNLLSDYSISLAILIMTYKFRRNA